MMSLLAAALLAQSPAPTTSPPLAKWTVKWDAFTCSLQRSGEGNGGLLLQIEAMPLQPAPTLLVAAPGTEKDLLDDVLDAKVRLEPSGEVIEGYAKPMSWRRAGRGLEFNTKDETFLDRLAASRAVVVSVKGRELARIGFADAAGAVRNLRRCDDALAREWKIDPDFIASLRRKPEPREKPNYWVQDEDYPLTAQLRGEGGLLILRYTVGVDGRARDCTILKPTASESINRRSCGFLVTRARYRPALGPDGKPVAAPVVMPILFIMPTG